MSKPEFPSRWNAQAVSTESQISSKDHFVPVACHHAFCEEADDDFFLPNLPLLTPRVKVRRRAYGHSLARRFVWHLVPTRFGLWAPRSAACIRTSMHFVLLAILIMSGARSTAASLLRHNRPTKSQRNYPTVTECCF